MDDGLDRDAARHLTRVIPAHAVGQDEKADIVSVPIISSLCSRTFPVSVSATLDIFPFKLMGLVQSWRSTRHMRPAIL